MKQISFSDFQEIANINPEVLEEAKFNIDNLDRVTVLLAKLAGKIAKAPFGKVRFESWGDMDYRKKDGTIGSGKFFMNKAGEKLRIGYSKTKGIDSRSVEINSIDFWDSNNFNLEEPTRSIVCYPHYNIVDIAKDAMTYAVTGESPSSRLTEDRLDEMRSSKKFTAYALSKGVSQSELDSKTPYLVQKQMKKDGLWIEEEYKGFKTVSRQETNSAGGSMRSATKALKERKFADPDVVFSDIEDLVSVVASGHQNSLIVAGMAGIGKTYHVETKMKEILGKEGIKWKHFKGGKISPYGIYSTLFEYRDDKVIVFDDSDSVWRDQDMVNMFKAALDTYDQRKLFWSSRMTQPVGGWDDVQREEHNRKCDDILQGVEEGDLGKDIKLPSEFTFTSRVIFISNLAPNKIDSAIRSRSLFMDIYLKREDVVKRIESILKSAPKYKHIGDKERKDILTSLQEGSGELTMRAVEAAVACKSTEGIKGDWKRLAKMYANGGD